MKMMMMSPNIDDDDDDVDSTVSTVSTPAKSRASRRAPHTALPREATRTRARTTRERRIRTRRERRRRRILLITTLTTSCTYQRRSRFAMMMMMLMCVCAFVCDDTFDAFSRSNFSSFFFALKILPEKKDVGSSSEHTRASPRRKRSSLMRTPLLFRNTEEDLEIGAFSRCIRYSPLCTEQREKHTSSKRLQCNEVIGIHDLLGFLLFFRVSIRGVSSLLCPLSLLFLSHQNDVKKGTPIIMRRLCVRVRYYLLWSTLHQ